MCFIIRGHDFVYDKFGTFFFPVVCQVGVIIEIDTIILLIQIGTIGNTIRTARRIEPLISKYIQVVFVDNAVIIEVSIRTVVEFKTGCNGGFGR
ncbi:MAG: hypothetical protein ACYS5F_14365 [Planctomycetota bacterium]|jgi:hypothetical protein